jgi:hypothetical protein
MKLLGIKLDSKFLIYGIAGLVIGRFILPRLEGSFASNNKISRLSQCGIDGEIGGPPQPNTPCAFCWNYDCSTHSWHCGGC